MTYGATLSEAEQLAREVQRIFPEPVGYIDRSGMLPSYPKVGFLMSTWGVEGVVARGKPTLAPLIRRRQPPLRSRPPTG